MQIGALCNFAQLAFVFGGSFVRVGELLPCKSDIVKPPRLICVVVCFFTHQTISWRRLRYVSCAAFRVATYDL